MEMNRWWFGWSRTSPLPFFPVVSCQARNANTCCVMRRSCSILCESAESRRHPSIHFLFLRPPPHTHTHTFFWVAEVFWSLAAQRDISILILRECFRGSFSTYRKCGISSCTKRQSQPFSIYDVCLWRLWGSSPGSGQPSRLCAFPVLYCELSVSVFLTRVCVVCPSRTGPHIPPSPSAGARG